MEHVNGKWVYGVMYVWMSCMNGNFYYLLDMFSEEITWNLLKHLTIVLCQYAINNLLLYRMETTNIRLWTGGTYTSLCSTNIKVNKYLKQQKLPKSGWIVVKSSCGAL